MRRLYRFFAGFTGLIFISIIPSCSNVSLPATPTPFLANAPISTATLVPTPTFPPLPDGVSTLKIDGVKTNPEIDLIRNTWVWRNKQGEIRRLLDPASQHILARTSSPLDCLVYEIDIGFGWEANLTNILYYGAHAPFGSSYLWLLSAKYPQLFPDLDKETSIVFRIMLGDSNYLSNRSQISYSGEVLKGTEATFLKPLFQTVANEYILTMILPAVRPSQRISINTYTDWMLNYCINSEYPQNPNGAWGIEIYKHPFK